VTQRLVQGENIKLEVRGPRQLTNDQVAKLNEFNSRVEKSQNREDIEKAKEELKKGAPDFNVNVLKNESTVITAPNEEIRVLP
jgi:hypothetical protein